MAFTTTINSTSNTKKIDEYVFTNNKVFLSHFEPPKFYIVLAIHVYDNAVAFGLRDFAATYLFMFSCKKFFWAKTC